MQQEDWRVEGYRGLDAYVQVTAGADAGGVRRWGYEARIAQEGMDPSDAGDTEILLSGEQYFATSHAAEVAAFSAAYALIDRLIGPIR